MTFSVLRSTKQNLLNCATWVGDEKLHITYKQNTYARCCRARLFCSVIICIKLFFAVHAKLCTRHHRRTAFPLMVYADEVRVIYMHEEGEDGSLKRQNWLRVENRDLTWTFADFKVLIVSWVAKKDIQENVLLVINWWKKDFKNCEYLFEVNVVRVQKFKACYVSCFTKESFRGNKLVVSCLLERVTKTTCKDGHQLLM